MTLDTFLTEAGVTDAEFAERIGISRSMVTKLRHGNARPSASTALKIEQVTNRRVTLLELMSAAEEHRASSDEDVRAAS